MEGLRANQDALQGGCQVPAVAARAPALPYLVVLAVAGVVQRARQAARLALHAPLVDAVLRAGKEGRPRCLVGGR